MLVPPEKNAFLNLLQSRQVFAYPTEAVYGLGGDPRAPEVFAEILRLKGARQPGQGMLLDQKRGRGEYGDLFATHHRHKRGA